MASDPEEAARAIRAIVADEPFDWVSQPGADPTTDQLRVLCEIARVHRAAAAGDTDAASTVGTAPPISVGQPTGKWMHLYLLESIGRGSSGAVYRAWDSRLAREAALKLMAASDAGTSATLVEARRLARVHHPHVVSVYGADQAEGRVGVWMELLEGQTLQELVQAQGPLSAREAALVGADVCSALAAVHGVGLLHRDVKAQNVLREHGGRIVLMDLGAGRDIGADLTFDLAGTPLYMAPEVFTGGSATVLSDIYSVGVLLFFLTTGTVPVPAATLEEIRRAHADRSGRSLRDARPNLPRDFIDIVDRALTREPHRRFGSAGEMERALLATVAAPRIAAAGHSHTSRVRRLFGSKLPAWIVVPVALAAALAVMIGGHIGPFARTTSPLAAGTPDRSANAEVRPLSGDQSRVARGFEELAESLAAGGQWTEAVNQYLEAERIYRVNTSPEAPLVGAILSKLAWAQQHAGQLDKAQYNYELAFAKLQNVEALPLMETTLAALATLQQSAARYQDAVATIDRALQIRARVLSGRSGNNGGLKGAGISDARLAELMPSLQLASDEDGDWLPDLLEAAVGLNPKMRDTDGDGQPDGDEDADGDGVSNALEFALTVDPTKIVAHYGAIDPEWLGFEQQDNRRIVGRAATSAIGPVWAVPTVGQSLYIHPFTSAQRAAAMGRGWRVAIGGELYAGSAFVCIDLAPDGPRFDIQFYRDAFNGVYAQLNTSIVPLAGRYETISNTSHWTLAELEYDPSVKGATLLVDGVRRAATPYPGHSQFQDRLGLFFGSSTNVGKVAKGEAAFGLARFVIR
jgi:tetratricopeptide (TPR) repeat protein